MSSLTTALSHHLHLDLSKHLDSYQMAVMADGGDSWPDITTREAQCLALGKSLLKKYNDRTFPSETACEGALKKFLDSNERCARYEMCPENSSDEVLLGTVKSILWDFWNDSGYSLVSTWNELHAHGSLGKGMNICARASDLYTKLFDSALSCTSDELSFTWEKLTSHDPRWANAEQARSTRYGTRVVAGNKLSFVNKNVTVARGICTEPTINMWYQLGMGAIQEKRLRAYTGIDLATQPSFNARLARVGSRTGRFATIDLESASDSMSLRMLTDMLPKDWMQWLVRLRSPTTTLPSKEVLDLSMVSSMGNGFNFSLQTLLFSAVVIAVYRCRGVKPSARGKRLNYGVFGDDIVVEKRLAPIVIRVLGLLGFRVNRDKTFVEGPFRESCGHDYFKGRWCRGVYIKRLHTQQDAFAAINMLNRWSASTGVHLPNIVGYLSDWCKTLLHVPPYENDDAGVHVPFDSARGIRHLQHGLTSYKRRVSKSLYLYVNESEGGDVVCETTEDPKRRTNLHGLYLCFLYGSLKGYRLNLRQRSPRYTTKCKVTSYWNTLSPLSRFRTKTGWQRWSDAVHYNSCSELRG